VSMNRYVASPFAWLVGTVDDVTSRSEVRILSPAPNPPLKTSKDVRSGRVILGKRDEGWCGAGDDWPRPCEQHNCTGLLHTNFGDYDYDGPNAFWLDVRCYKCGTSEY